MFFLPEDLVIGRTSISNGRCMDILCRRVYQGCVCHVAVTSIIASTFSRRMLFITGPVKVKGGNVKTNVLSQFCCIASACVAKVFGSGLYAIY